MQPPICLRGHRLKHLSLGPGLVSGGRIGSLVVGLAQRLEAELEMASFPHVACDEMLTVSFPEEVH